MLFLMHFYSKLNEEFLLFLCATFHNIFPTTFYDLYFYLVL